MNAWCKRLPFAVLLPLTVAAADDKDEMKPYPLPEAGIQRLAFRVPAVANEDDRKVEILAGKVIPVDCNRTFFGGSIQERTAEGWGFPYYVVETKGQRVSTMMACPPGEEKKDAFVPVRGEGFLIRYNSKLPVVVYAPDGFEVRYRIWTAGEEAEGAEPR